MLARTANTVAVGIIARLRELAMLLIVSRVQQGSSRASVRSVVLIVLQGAGRYIPVIEASDCIPCPAGRYTEVLGAAAVDACTICATGRYIGIEGAVRSADCKECPMSYYIN
jgi:hypothetical protein